MTKKQAELLKDMYGVLDNEFDFGTIGKRKNYTAGQAYQLIALNKDMYYLIVEEGQCTPRQYKKLTAIAGRTPKLPRHLIGYSTAAEWINKYTNRKVG